MYRPFTILFLALVIVLAAAPAFADSITVTLSGNFGAPLSGGSSIFDNQDYSISFVIPDPSSPSSTTCCISNISAAYDVNAHLGVPGIGLAQDNAVEVQYERLLLSDEWLNIASFTGLPGGDFLVLTPFRIDSGQLWNGLAGALGTPVIYPLHNAPGTGIWHLEQPGATPVAVYPDGAITITAAATTAVPEPSTLILICLGLFGLIGCGWRRGKG